MNNRTRIFAIPILTALLTAGCTSRVEPTAPDLRAVQLETSEQLAVELAQAGHQLSNSWKGEVALALAERLPATLAETLDAGAPESARMAIAIKASLDQRLASDFSSALDDVTAITESQL